MRRKKKRKETGKKRLMEPRRSGCQVRRLGPRANEMEERSTSQKS